MNTKAHTQKCAHAYKNTHTHKCVYMHNNRHTHKCVHIQDINKHKDWHTLKFNDQFEILYDIKYIIQCYLKKQ